MLPGQDGRQRKCPPPLTVPKINAAGAIPTAELKDSHPSASVRHMVPLILCTVKGTARSCTSGGWAWPLAGI